MQEAALSQGEVAGNLKAAVEAAGLPSLERGRTSERGWKVAKAAGAGG